MTLANLTLANMTKANSTSASLILAYLTLANLTLSDSGQLYSKHKSNQIQSYPNLIQTKTKPKLNLKPDLCRPDLTWGSIMLRPYVFYIKMEFTVIFPVTLEKVSVKIEVKAQDLFFLH